MPTPCLSLMRHPPYIQPSYLDGMSAQSEGFEHIRACADSRVKDDLHFCRRNDSSSVKFTEMGKNEWISLTGAYGIYDLRQYFQAPHSSIHLPTSMVRHHYTLTPHLVRFQCVFDTLDAFDDEWTAIGYTFPL